MWINYEYQRNKRRILRKNSTPQEVLLWGRIRNNQLGHKWRRQYSIGNYVADFYCHEKKLVIEVDGSHHNHTIEYDRIREQYFSNFGMRTIRFWNNEINTNLEAVIMKIVQELQKE
jgi:very-short-patch-repair endonuclease